MTVIAEIIGILVLFVIMCVGVANLIEHYFIGTRPLPMKHRKKKPNESR